MRISLRNLRRDGDPEAERVLDAAFQRSERESRLVRELARSHPLFDPELAPVAEREGRTLGCAALLPRRVRIRGQSVPLALVGPLGVDPAFRGQGIASELLRVALERAAQRGILGALALGMPEFFGRRGFAQAFDLWGLRVPTEILPAEITDAPWRGLVGEDLPHLAELHAHSYRGVSCSEERTGDALDFESFAPRAHTLVHPGAGRPLAYLRFRVREELELLECSARTAAGVAAILALLRRLCREHARLSLFARLPEPHAVARALFRRGALQERSDLGGAGMLRVLDWPALLEILAPVWTPALDGLVRPAFSLGIGRECWRLELEQGRPRVLSGRVGGAHLALGEAQAPALLTGQRGFEELFEEEAVRAASELSTELCARLAAYLGPSPASWGYAPVFELAED